MEGIEIQVGRFGTLWHFELAVKSFQYLEVHILNDFPLHCASFHVMIETRCGVDLEDPVFFRLLRDIADDHKIDTTQAQAHIFSQRDGNFFECGMNLIRDVFGVTARR